MSIILFVYISVVFFLLVSIAVHLCHRHPETAKLVGICTLVVATLFAMFIFAPAVKAEEVRTVFVTGFRLDISCFEVTDEDGFCWRFELGEHDYALGDEYMLILEEGEEPVLCYVEELY